jgi:hypothetical protein
MTHILASLILIGGLSLAGIFALVDGTRLARLARRGEI